MNGFHMTWVCMRYLHNTAEMDEPPPLYVYSHEEGQRLFGTSKHGLH